MNLLLITTLAAAATGGAADGQAALQSLEKAYGKTNALTATYTQKRTSVLMREPLTSTGKLAFTREPAVLRFQTKSTVIRVTKDKYEVYRPSAKVVEQADLPKEAWTSLLFATFSQQMDALLERMSVTGSTVKGARRTIRLAPKSKSDQARVRGVEVVVDEKAGRLVSLAYTDPGGDEVRIELDAVKTHESLPAKATALGAPADAKRVTLKAD